MASAKPALPLAGLTIAFAGSHTACDAFIDQKIAQVKDAISQCGGIYATKVTQECTHLVASPKQFDANGAKVKEAVARSDVSIVNFDWLVKSLDSKKKVKEDTYLLTSSAGATSAVPANSSASNGKKRGRQATPDDDDDDDDDILQAGFAPKTKKLKASTKDGQKAKSASIHIPIDDHCDLSGTHKVHVGDDGTIFDVTLNQTNSGQNNNKFYRIQLLVDASNDDYRTWTRWGRVGDYGQKALLGGGAFGDAMSAFERKFKDKTGHSWDNRLEPAKPKKYTFIERNYEDSSNEDDDDLPGAGKRRASKESISSEGQEPVQSRLPGAVQRLMTLIFNQEYFDQTMASMDYDAHKMPLGKLSKRTLKSGYQILKDIAALVGNQGLAQSQYGTSWAEATEALSNQYFSTIPHVFGRNRPPVIRETALIKKEIELLETLTDMQLANEIMKSAKGDKDDKEKEKINLMDRQYEGLGMQEMTPLDMGSSEYGQISEYLIKSAGQTHNLKYKVHDIFRIERQGENDRFAKSPYAAIKNSDRRLLWHGSRCTNFGGILSQGLRIAPPEAPVSGYMFGKGVYLADMSSKSANYCASYSSGNVGLLLLCEAELGKPPLQLVNSDYNAGDRAKQEGRLSTLGIGTTAPKAWKDAGSVNENLKGVLMPDVSTKAPGPSGEPNAGLLYNEYIVYDVSQIRLRYLLRVQMD